MLVVGNTPEIRQAALHLWATVKNVDITIPPPPGQRRKRPLPSLPHPTLELLRHSLRQTAGEVLASGFETDGEDYDVNRAQMDLTIKLKRPEPDSVDQNHAKTRRTTRKTRKRTARPEPDPNAKPQQHGQKLFRDSVFNPWSSSLRMGNQPSAIANMGLPGR